VQVRLIGPTGAKSNSKMAFARPGLPGLLQPHYNQLCHPARLRYSLSSEDRAASAARNPSSPVPGFPSGPGSGAAYFLGVLRRRVLRGLRRDHGSRDHSDRLLPVSGRDEYGTPRGWCASTEVGIHRALSESGEGAKGAGHRESRLDASAVPILLAPWLANRLSGLTWRRPGERAWQLRCCRSFPSY
jgi:hypothetical protein